MSAAVFAAALQVLSLACCYFHVVVVLVSGVVQGRSIQPEDPLGLLEHWRRPPAASSSSPFAAKAGRSCTVLHQYYSASRVVLVGTRFSPRRPPSVRDPSSRSVAVAVRDPSRSAAVAAPPQELAPSRRVNSRKHAPTLPRPDARGRSIKMLMA